jgi:hypothetical protein
LAQFPRSMPWIVEEIAICRMAQLL